MIDLTHHLPFLRAVVAAPDDDLPRSIYADWLDENGEPERAEFIRVQCELAKLGPPHVVVTERCVADRRYGPNYYSLTGGEGLARGSRLIMEVKVGDRVDVMKPRGRKGPLYGLRVSRITDDEVILVNDDQSAPWGGDELRHREQELLAKWLTRWITILPGADLIHAPPTFVNCSTSPYSTVVFRRGFVESLTLSAADWLAHADRITAVTPIREVTLTDHPEGSVSVVEAQRRWKTPVWAGDHVLTCWRAEWPGIKFTLPPVAATTMRAGHMVTIGPDGQYRPATVGEQPVGYAVTNSLLRIGGQDVQWPQPTSP